MFVVTLSKQQPKHTAHGGATPEGGRNRPCRTRSPMAVEAAGIIPRAEVLPLADASPRGGGGGSWAADGRRLRGRLGCFDVATGHLVYKGRLSLRLR
jgi:hypothetical protein